MVTRKAVSPIERKMTAGGQPDLAGHDRWEENAADPDNLEQIAHDIRSSVNVIVGYAQLMLDQTTGKINAKQRQALRDILNSTGRLHDLTDKVIRKLDSMSDEK